MQKLFFIDKLNVNINIIIIFFITNLIILGRYIPNNNESMIRGGHRRQLGKLDVPNFR